MRKLREWWKQRNQLITIFSKMRRPASLTKLYVVDVGGPVPAEQAEALNRMFDPLRKKYGIDFIVLEPGIRLRRFDDI